MPAKDKYHNVVKNALIMEKLTHYRNLIPEIIKKYYDMSNYQPANTTETTVSDRLILDEQRDQYLWLRCGWDGKKRVQYIVLYLQIQNGKIWVEEDSTDLGIVDDLLAAGIPKINIILGFHHPSTAARKSKVKSQKYCSPGFGVILNGMFISAVLYY